MHFNEQKDKLRKTTESKLENPTHSVRETNHALQKFSKAFTVSLRTKNH